MWIGNPKVVIQHMRSIAEEHQMHACIPPKLYNAPEKKVPKNRPAALAA
tara:strand:- start:84 stop:230 length:147 start_codon:yes stop_codon:yes gene_type:complete